MADDIEARILEVLDRAAAVFRPGSPSRTDLDFLAAKLRRPGVRLSTLVGSGEGEVRRHAAALEEAAAALRAAAEEIADDPLVDIFEIRDVEAKAKALRMGLRERRERTVTHQDVIHVLAGSWGDSELSEDIRGLVRELEGREAAAAPAGP